MTRPGISFAVVEAGTSLGGTHTWSFHGTDVTPAQLEWLWVLCAKSWPSHDVLFPGRTRRMGGGYHSMTSKDVHWKLAERLGDRLRLRTRATAVTGTSVTLATGEVLEAKAVIDGRGFTAAPAWPCGYQKFLGLEVELAAPHGLEVPLLMDARVEQADGFRFLYLLPWDERRLLVEDTIYSDTPELNHAELERRIQAYLQERGLKVAKVLGRESAALPIPLEGEAPSLSNPTVGVAAGLFHATTGYSVPMAAALADDLVTQAPLEAGPLTTWLNARVQAHWASQRFFRMLNRMLFRGATPEQRVKIFESFYAHGEGLIARFYAGRITTMDQLWILARGAPTVPGRRAIRAALGP